MKCPKCKGGNVYTRDTRHTAEHETKRRRECTDCGWCFFTIEITMEKYKQMNRAKNELQQILQQEEITKGGATDE